MEDEKDRLTQLGFDLPNPLFITDRDGKVKFHKGDDVSIIYLPLMDHEKTEYLNDKSIGKTEVNVQYTMRTINVHQDCLSPYLLQSQEDLYLFSHYYLCFKENTDILNIQRRAKYETTKALENRINLIVKMSEKFDEYFDLLQKSKLKK